MESDLTTEEVNANYACLLLRVVKWNDFHKCTEKKV